MPESIRKRRWLCVVAAAWIASAPIAPTLAGAGAGVAVDATVRPYARIVAKSGPEVLDVTAEDVARGFVDAPAATVLAVKTNARQGYDLRVDRQGDPLFLVVEIGDLGATLGPEGGRIERDQPGVSTDHVALRWRFYLLEDVEPGLRPWPVRLSVSPRDRRL